MTAIQVRYWRDIPAMVSAGRGRGAAKAVLPERFEQAIDRCAMKIGAKEEDAYIAEWRAASEGVVPEGEDAQAAVARFAAELDAAYDPERLKKLIENDGWSETTG